MEGISCFWFVINLCGYPEDEFDITLSSRWGCDAPPGVSSPLSTAGPMHIAMVLRWLPCANWLRGAVRANDLPLSNDLEAWPDSSVGRTPTYKVRGREFESRSGRLFSRTFTFHLTCIGYITPTYRTSLCIAGDAQELWGTVVLLLEV